MSSSKPWVDGLTLGQALQQTAAAHPKRDAVVFPAIGVRYRYREFEERVNEAARGLLALGLLKGDHIAIWATNVPEWPVLQFAAARIGVVLATVNPAYRPFELHYVLRQSDAAALFLIDRFKSSDYFAMLREVCPELSQSAPGELAASEFPKLKWIVHLKGQRLEGAISWTEMCRRGADQERALQAAESALSPGDAINIQYTSGTTGFPKAATLTHRNLLMNAYYVGDCQRLTPHDRLCVPVPFYHCFGCVMGTICAVVHGAAMIVPAEHFDAAATLRAIQAERATAVYGVPTMFIAQLQHETFKSADLSSLRTGIMAGSPCPIEVMRQVVERMGVREITIAYGQTEASPVITQTRTDDALELRVETVGRPLLGVEVKLVDPATGDELGDEQRGELCARGHGVMLGYYKNPEATAAAIDHDGWLHTGDLALRHANGYYRIMGRLKDLVIRGGENVYPREIEEFLFTHPDIEQAVVVGVPDPRYVEELCAWIKLRPGASLTEEGLRQFCRDNMAHYKIPKYIRFVEEFPQTVTGKIQKFRIRERMIAELGLSEQETA